MRWVVGVILMLVPVNAWTGQMIEARELSLTYRKFHDSSRHPLLYRTKPDSGIDLDVNMDIARYFFWDNKIHALMDQHQYRLVGWNFKVGLRVFQSLEVQYEHHSQHLLEDRYPYAPYPLEDSIGFKLILFRKDVRSLF
jgi:hypothetical protein